MGTLHRLVTAFLLINLLLEVTSFNPDSEIIQDPSNDNERNKTNLKRSAPVVYVNQRGTSSAEIEQFRISTVHELRQIRPGGMMIMWRPISYPVTSSKRESFIYGNRRTDFVVATDDKPTGNSNSNRNSIKEVLREEGLSDKGFTNTANNGNRPNSFLFDEDSPNISDDVKKVSYGIRNSGSGSNGQRDRNIPNIQPTQYPQRLNPTQYTQSPNMPDNVKNVFQGTRNSGQASNGQRDRNVPDVQPTQYAQRPNPGSSDLGNREADNNSNRMGPQPSAKPVHVLVGSRENSVKGSANRPLRQRPDSVPGNRFNPNSRVSPDSSFFAGIINDFSFTLVGILNSETNFVISPLSIFIALSMCYLGSEGTTKDQLENALGLNKNSVHGAKLHQGIHDLEALALSRSSAYQLFLANGLFIAKNFSVNPEYRRDMKGYYAAEVISLDFANPDLSEISIRDWVSKNTQNTIRSFFDIPPARETRALILNAIYFKGIWKTQFPPQSTYDRSFFPAGGGSKKVPTMNIENQTFPLCRSDEYRHSFIKLPYQGDQISMIIALPDDFSDKPMPNITDQILCSLRDCMTDTLLDTVAIPKFKLEHSTKLKEALQRLGITNLFDPEFADLRNMRRETDVFVSTVAHKAVIEVNEQGTTAYAVTNVVYRPLLLTTDFVVNRPFAFYVLHEPSGLVLFHGKVYDIIDENVTPTPNDSRKEESQRRQHGSGSRG